MFKTKTNLNQPKKEFYNRGPIFVYPKEFESKASQITCTATGDISKAQGEKGVYNTSKAVAVDVACYNDFGVKIQNIAADIALTKSVVKGKPTFVGGVKFRLKEIDGSALGYMAFAISNDNIGSTNVAYSIVTNSSNSDYLLKTIRVTHFPETLETKEVIKFETIDFDLCYPICNLEGCSSVCI